MRQLRWFVTPMLLASAGLVGCASSTPVAPATAAAQKANEKPSALAATGAAITGGFAKATDWMKPKPTVVPAKDPTSLAVTPPKMGPDIYVSMARIHESKGKFDLAAGQYEKALKLNANDEAALLGYAHLLDRQNKLPEATTYYEKAVKAHPTSAAAHNDLGMCYARRGMYPQASDMLRKAVSIDKTKPLYHNNLATLLVEMQRDDEALRELLAVHDPASAHYNLGVLLHRKGQMDGAARHFAEASRLNPSLQAAQVWLAKMNETERGMMAAAPESQAPASRLVPAARPVSATSEYQPVSPPPQRDPNRYDPNAAPEPPARVTSREGAGGPVRLPRVSSGYGEPENAPLPGQR